MTPALVITLGALLWVLAGFSVAGVAARHGHFLPAWLALGTLCGPFTWSLYQLSLSREAEAQPHLITAGSPGPGPVSVLVGVDGSNGSIAAVTTISGLLGERLGRLTIASVLDYDTALDLTDYPERTRASAELAAAVASLVPVTHVTPDTVILAGRPAEALERYANDNGLDLVVIGSRGRGLTKALIGSTAAELSKRCRVPVLIVGGAENTPERAASR